MSDNLTRTELATFERFELELTADDARSGSHQGQCDDDIAALRETIYIKAQLATIDPEKLRAELEEYGAWSVDELTDHDANLSRVLWLACCYVREELSA